MRIDPIPLMDAFVEPSASVTQVADDDFGHLEKDMNSSGVVHMCGNAPESMTKERDLFGGLFSTLFKATALHVIWSIE